MKARIIILAVLTALLMTGCKYFEKHKLFTNQVDTLLEYTDDEEEQIDSSEIVPPVEPMDMETEEDIAEEPAKEVTVSSAGPGYYMIVGSFLNNNYAERYAENLREKGYQARIIHAANGFNRVSAQSYDNLQAAVNDIPNFRSTLVPRAWVHIKR